MSLLQFLGTAVLAVIILVVVAIGARRFPQFTLRWKFITSFLAVVILSVTAVTLINGQVLRTRLTESVGINLQNLAASKAQAVGDLLAKQADTLEALSANRVLQEHLEERHLAYEAESDPAAIEAELRQAEAAWTEAASNSPLVEAALQNDIATELLRFRNTFPENVEVLVTDSRGALVAATNQTGHYYFAEEAWWQETYRNGRGNLFIGHEEIEPEDANESGSGVVSIALPVYGRSAQVVVGVLRTSFSMDVFLDIMLYEEQDTQGQVDLYTGDAHVFVPSPAGVTFITLNEAETRQLADLRREEVVYRELAYNSSADLVSEARVFTTDPGTRLPIAALDWSVISYQEQSEALAIVNASRQTTLLTGLAALLLAGILAVFVAQALSRPIARLIAAANQVAAGDLSTRAVVDTGGEIGQLIDTFNEMTAALNRTLNTVTERTQMLETSAEVARATSASLDLQEVLSRSVELIHTHFGFYHASVFLIEPGTETAVLRQVAGAAKHRFMQQSHQLQVGSRSLVGQATSTHQPIVVQNVAEDLNYFSNPLLPQTKAEAVFPLLVGNEIIGALDVQSEETGTFTEDFVSLFRTLADQIAIAVQHARLYDEQRQAMERLAEADRLKTQFLANMSHELRTPLNSIIGFSRLMLKGIDGPVSDAQHEDLETIHRNGQHLLGIINNILDLSKIEAGKMALVWEDIDVGQIMATIKATAEGLVKDKPIKVICTVPEDLPPVEADATRLRQILLNLVSNAAKFTEEGQIILTVLADRNRITFIVTDTGIGIPPEKQSTIFEEFIQVDSSASRRYEGTGLGLPITKKLIKLHHGDITLDSTPGKGSTFSFYLPWRQPQVSENGSDPAGQEDALSTESLSAAS